jgi:hypothetical protein
MGKKYWEFVLGEECKFIFLRTFKYQTFKFWDEKGK